MVIMMRFIVKKCDEEYCIFDVENDKNVVAVCDVERICQITCDLLNQLNDENEQLKFELKECQEHKLFNRRELERENELLKSALKELKEIGDYQSGRIKELNDENEQLKIQLQGILKLTRKIEDYTHDIKMIGDMND